MRNSHSAAQCKERAQSEKFEHEIEYYRLSGNAFIPYLISIHKYYWAMVVKCEVKFDNNPSGVFFAGQVNFNEHQFSRDKKYQNLLNFIMFIRRFRESLN